MSIYSKMTAIADAIREKTGGTDPLTLDAMAEAIAGIEAGGGSSGGSTLLESGSFTLAAESMKYDVELTNVPDLFICYAEVPETDTSSAALDGAVCFNNPKLANMFPYETDYVTNINFLINWYTAGTHQILAGYSYVIKNGTGAIAKLVARSSAYKLEAKTYKWESYRLWE